MKTKRSAIGYLLTTVKVLIYTFLILFVTVVLLQKFTNNSITLFNYRLFTVVTGSMKPKYNIGDVLLCKEVNPSELQVGDDISYLGKESSFKGKVVTHRIIKKEKNNKGEWIFYTQGLANNIPDPTITSNQIYGKVVRNMSLLSKVHKLISTPGGVYLCIFIPLLILIGSEIISSMVERFEHKRLKD
mgnify:CR=1 FL=1